MATLWMGDLEAYMDDFFIMQAFEEMGEPATQVKLIQNKYTGAGEDDPYLKIYGVEREIGEKVGHKYPELRLPAGYCFVDFSDSESAQRAMLRLNGKIIPHSQPPHRFKLNNSGYTNEQLKKKEFSLFVGELTEEVDDYKLYQSFAKRYSSCHTAKVVMDVTGRSKGFGFVRFTDEGDQQRALIEMQHRMGIGRKPIRVSLATPKKQKNDSDPPNAGYGQPYGQQGYYGRSSGYYSYQDYANYYQQYYAGQYPNPPADARRPQSEQSSFSQSSEDADVLEEPELEIDVDQYNQSYMKQSEELYVLLEESRWNGMEQWNNKSPPAERFDSTGTDDDETVSY